MKTKNFLIVPALLALVSSSLALAADEAPKPKYGPQATRLYHDREYIREAEAPDFWALIPYYIHQQDGRSCSVASVTMLINAARAPQRLTASDELITQGAILKKVNSPVWKKGVGRGGRGVTLDELGEIIRKSLKAYGFQSAQVEVVHVSESGDAARKQLHSVLAQNERNANDFLVANFLQSEYTGDPEGAVGHIAPIAAYDARKKQVLILDPDRQYYEPYWVSEETLFKGLNTQDKTSGKHRGYVHVKVRPSR